MRQTDCLPGVSEKFVILRGFTRIIKQCKNAPQILFRNKWFAQKRVFQELAIMQEKKMSDDYLNLTGAFSSSFLKPRIDKPLRS